MEAFMAAFKQPPKLDIGTKEGGKNKLKNQNLPWVEKYRPKTINEVSHQDEVIAVLKKTISNFDLPNLLFYGPPGSGKTSTILAAARELFGHELYSDRVLELNASDERGIDVVRTKIKKFSQLMAPGHRADGQPCPPFKIVILDEADSMTPPAQAALRRTMEKESRSTRFCLVCNYISRIIDPITSRCAKFRFKALDETLAFDRVRFIAESERVQVNDEALRGLIVASDGDLRQAITLLQSCSMLVAAEGDYVSMEMVAEVIGKIPQRLIDAAFKAVMDCKFDQLQTAVKAILLEGFSAFQTVYQCYDYVSVWNEINDTKRAIILDHAAKVDERLMDGSDEYLQLLCLFSVIMEAYHSR